MEHILPSEFCRDSAFDHHPDLSALAQALFTPRKRYLGVWKYHILIWFGCQFLQYVVELFSRVWCRVRCSNALFGMCQWNFATKSLWTVAGSPPNSMNTTCGEKAGGLANTVESETIAVGYVFFLTCFILIQIQSLRPNFFHTSKKPWSFF